MTEPAYLATTIQGIRSGCALTRLSRFQPPMNLPDHSLQLSDVLIAKRLSMYSSNTVINNNNEVTLLLLVSYHLLFLDHHSSVFSSSSSSSPRPFFNKKGTTGK